MLPMPSWRSATPAAVHWFFLLWRKSFGLPLVEARTRGCPVIASDVPALQELADRGVFLFRNNELEHLVSVLRDHIADDKRAVAGQMPNSTWKDRRMISWV